MIEAGSGACLLVLHEHSSTVLLVGVHPLCGTKFASARSLDDHACVVFGGMGEVKRVGNHVVLSTV